MNPVPDNTRDLLAIAKLTAELVEHIEYERDVEENGRLFDIWQTSNMLRPLLEELGLLEPV